MKQLKDLGSDLRSKMLNIKDDYYYNLYFGLFYIKSFQEFRILFYNFDLIKNLVFQELKR